MEPQNKIQPQKRQLSAGFHPCFHPNNQFLLKYSPKCCKKLTLSDYSGLTFSKVKKIKVLEELHLPYGSLSKRKMILKSLKDKRRHVKLLPIVLYSFIRYFHNRTSFFPISNSKCELKKFLLSSGLKSLALSIDKNSINTKRPKLYSWQFWDHLKRLRQLKNLDISLFNIFDEHLCDFLKKLESHVHITNSIKYVRLNIGFSTNSEEGWNFPNLFGRVTHLDVDNTYCFQKLFLPTVKQFTNITHLVLRLANLFKPLELSNLEVIGNIPTLLSANLQLTLHSATSLKNFLIYTNFPPSIKSITLKLVNIDWTLLIHNVQKQNYYEENPFEKDQTCTAFFKKWLHFKSLETLDFDFSLSGQSSMSSGLFLMPILRNLSNLITIKYSHQNGGFEAKKRTLVFAKFLEAMSHLKSTLRVLQISDQLVSLDDLNPHDLPSLSLQDLKISGYIIGDNKAYLLSKFFSKIDKKSGGLHGENVLNLGKVVIRDNESFVSFLKSLNKFVKRDMTVKINTDVRNVSQDFLNTALLGFVCEGNRIPNLLLRMMRVSRQNINRKELKTLLCKHHTFKSLELETETFEDIFFHFTDSKYKFSSGELSEDDDYIDDDSDYCDLEYTDDEGIEYFSDGVSNLYREIRN